MKNREEVKQIFSTMVSGNKTKIKKWDDCLYSKYADVAGMFENGRMTLEELKVRFFNLLDDMEWNFIVSVIGR